MHRAMEAGTAILTVQRLKHKEIKYGPYLVSSLLRAGKVCSNTSVSLEPRTSTTLMEIL